LGERVKKPMKLLLLLAVLPLLAHMVSMSTGDLRVDGVKARYELRMPLYEVAHIADPERAIFEHIRFEGARLIDHKCEPDPTALVCTANFEFSTAPEIVHAEVTFHAVTVPNHVHVLRAYRGDKTDQAVFDISASKAEIRFRPPTTLEIAVTQMGAGVQRAFGGMAQLLFLFALALAARTFSEWAALTAMFVVGQTAAVLIGYQPNPRFMEAAAALTVAYLAVEILLLPDAGSRWIVVGVLGVFQGLGLAFFVAESSYNPAYVISGASLAQASLLILLWLVTRQLNKVVMITRALAGLMLGVGLFWFVLRLRG
jgi:HupE / UreJ protein